MKLKKVVYIVYKNIFLFPLWRMGRKSFTPKYARFLRKLGVNVGKPYYIDYTCWFDSANYSLITIEDHVVISREVSFLIHDYSICRGIEAIGLKMKKEYRIEDSIKIGKNSFIGMRTTILPGTYIGQSCIIGAGSVIKG